VLDTTIDRFACAFVSLREVGREEVLAAAIEHNVRWVDRIPVAAAAWVVRLCSRRHKIWRWRLVHSEAYRWLETPLVALHAAGTDKGLRTVGARITNRAYPVTIDLFHSDYRGKTLER
jgi:hypothetical protein